MIGFMGEYGPAIGHKAVFALPTGPHFAAKCLADLIAHAPLLPCIC